MKDVPHDLNQVSQLQIVLDIQSISMIIAATSIVIGVIMSLLSIRNFSKSRQASVFLDFHRQANLEFIEHASEVVMEWNWKDAQEFDQKYGPTTNPKAYAKFILVGSFFDSMGKLIEAKLTDAKLFPESLAVFAMAWFEKIKSIEPDLAAQWRSSGSMDSSKLLHKKLRELGYRSPLRRNQT
ncbi:MAG: hypothetical protein BV458_07310 [Thermoplasmata archaeon M9B2D]|nr:MAG: hypothetical protein BV458_07310 [Thermoplasmata archaeon M9B2D]